MIKSKKFLDSFSPFWLLIDKAGVVKLHSDYFKEKLFIGKKYSEYFKIHKLFIKDQNNIIESLKDKNFSLRNDKEPPYRATIHIYNENEAVLVLWPMLEDINSIRTYEIQKEMQHPAALVTDIIISRDMYKQNFIKLQEMEKEKQQRRKLNEFSEIVSSTPSSFCIIDYDRKVNFINQQGLDFLEVSSIKDLNEIGIENIISQENRDQFLNFHKNICAGNKGSLIFKIVKKDDSIRWIESFSAPFILSDGKTGHVAISNDISERILMEIEAEKQKKINFHTTKLASLGQLAAGVGHEINNPMTIIKGNLSILRLIAEKQKLEDDKFNSSLEKMENSIERVTNIVRGLKSFSRDDIENNEIINISELLSETINLLKDIYMSQGVEIASEIPENFYSFGSYGRLQQVIINLLANAKDATGSSSEKIFLILSKNKDKIEIRVIDEGNGIENDIKERIFDPFFTTKKVNEGTGLGLSISHTIISDLGGELLLEKSDPKGTTFLIRLKLEEPDKLKSKLSEQTKNPNKSTEKSNLNILIVDDEEDILEILKSEMEFLGCEITTATNGRDALEILQKNQGKIDVLFTDMQMPKMNGVDLLKNAKDLFPNLFKIVISGGINIDLQSLEGQGLINGYLPKPFLPEDIEKLIQEILNQKNK